MGADGERTSAVEADNVAGVAPAATDLFIDPSGASGVAAESMLNAATLLTDAGDTDFQFVARVRVGFAGTFDAGVLLVWLHERAWAKLCFEYSPDGEPMVVSVVTREVSDDANSFVVDGDQVWLRVSRIGRVYAFHASLDGQTWRFVRAFAFGSDDPARIGFEVQSPSATAAPSRSMSSRSQRPLWPISATGRRSYFSAV